MLNPLKLSTRQLTLVSLLCFTLSACRTTESAETNIDFNQDPLQQGRLALSEGRFTLYSFNSAVEPLPGVDLNLMALSLIEAECGIQPLKIKGQSVQAQELTSDQMNYIRLYNRAVFRGCWTFMKDYPGGKK